MWFRPPKANNVQIIAVMTDYKKIYILKVNEIIQAGKIGSFCRKGHREFYCFGKAFVFRYHFHG